MRYLVEVENNEHIAARALRRAILGTLVLGVAKAAGAWWSGSHAVGASAADALTDALVSGANLVLVRAAAAPPDASHPFGHGKAEALAGLAQAAFLSVVIVGVGRSAVLRLMSGGELPLVGPAVLIMVGSMVSSYLLSRGLQRAADQTGSLVLRADAAHYRMDLWSGTGVLLGLVLSQILGDARIDAAASLLLCFWMAREVVPIAIDAVGELMDRPLDAMEQGKAEAVLAAFADRISGYHDLRTRRAGPRRFVQVHVELPGELQLREAHRIADDLEEALRTALPGCDPIVHIDPEEEVRARRAAGRLR